MPKIPTPSTNGHATVLTEAKRLNALGYWIVPCDGKRPIIKGWNDERLSIGELHKTLVGTRRNIAIALNQSELIDVECDSDEAKAALHELFGGALPPTPTWQSKRGKHRLFRRPSGLAEKAKLEIDGIEFRIGNGKGALSIVPPSIHPDGPRYEWLPGLSIHEVEPAELPIEVVERLCATSERPAADSTSGKKIREGKRNETLFKLACHLVKDLATKSVEAALLAENTARCEPPLSAAEVAEIARSAGSQGAKGAQTNAQILSEIALADSELWHTPDDIAFATIRRDSHREHWPVRSRAFKQWLAKQFYEREKNAPGSQTMQDVINVLEGMARFDGQTHPLFVRVAEHNGQIYLDLTNEDWQAVEVGSSGWRIVDDPPVRFRRAKGMLPLPVPERGGSVSDLRRFVNVSDEDWPLLIGWTVAAFRPIGPYPILKLLAEQGAGKTTTARILRSLIDPNTASVRSAPRSDRDLMIAATNGWVVSLDNLSYVTPELSDAICRLATGGGFATRTLYENDEETILNAQRPTILNGIEDIGTRSDLLDRSLIVELPRIEPGSRRPEKVFWREFEQARPQILGALLDAVSAALRNIEAVAKSENEWPRMADFAQWVVAAEEALEIKPDQFLAAYSSNRETANQTALESSPVVIALLAMLKRKRGVFEGKATELYNEIINGQDTRAKSWPKTPKVLSGLLARLAPNLRAVGISIEQTVAGSGNDKRKVWSISKTAETTVIPVCQPNRTSSKTCAPSDRCAPSGLAERLQSRGARVATVAK